ncbi:hypothetical protein BpHYR1_038709, partial [Brachionus plicatilis]
MSKTCSVNEILQNLCKFCKIAPYLKILQNFIYRTILYEISQWQIRRKGASKIEKYVYLKNTIHAAICIIFKKIIAKVFGLEKDR